MAICHPLFLTIEVSDFSGLFLCQFLKLFILKSQSLSVLFIVTKGIKLNNDDCMIIYKKKVVT
ncbi:hypothetical protein DMB72_02445 [Staphylococcus saccharolyticus]|nr:hypothetical protein DMB72_02445 [Staphylococcus saccharolyticus]TAB00553.1 hypothetical protein DMB73_01800 [Staphylococcus saccharolyticus]TAB02789.1 hypothetical protein DMB78_02445 [Staphylococcus saccharolyticus]